MLTLDANFIDGRWIPGQGAAATVVDPSTGAPYAEVRFGDVADVDAAVRAAQAAFPAWSAAPPADRAAALRRLHGILRDRTEAFVQAAAQEIGAPVWFGRALATAMPLRNLELAIEAIDELFAGEQVGASIVLREPIGVVAAITPWNVPLHQIVAKVGAALAAGCTSVLKPSEIAPLSARLFAEAVQDADLPAGVFNMVLGDAAVGEALVGHPLVDMVSFTGSSAVGRRVAALAADGVKKVSLELGGKSASIMLDDADLEEAVATVVRQCFANSGQTCVSQSRLLVPRAVLSQVEALCAAQADTWTIGHPGANGVRLGPVATRAQYERVRAFIAAGIEEGAKLVAGGLDPVDGAGDGFFVRPTVFSEVTRDMSIAREEIFGPVLSVMPYADVEEAVDIANDLPYGLSGGVWSADRSRAEQVARRMRTGQVAVNGAPQNLATPFGGYRQSGYGRENGRYGVEEFLQYKAIHGVA